MAPPPTARRRPPASRAPRSRASRLAGAGLVLVLLGAACSDDDEDATPEPTTTSTSRTADGGPTSSTSTAPPSTTPTTVAGAPTTSTSTPATTSTQPFDGSTERVEIPRPAGTQEVVAHTALSVTSSGGEERIAFEFDGSLPGVVVEHVDPPVYEAGSGDAVAVEGEALLSIRFEPASSARVDGEEVTRTYAGSERVAGTGGTVAEVVRTGDFEALYEWVAGLAAGVPFRVDVDEASGSITVVVPAG